MYLRRASALLSVFGALGVMSFALAASAQASPYARAGNVPVCPGPAAAGSARCHARVLTDASGVPLVTDISSGGNGRPGGGGGGTTPPGYGPAQLEGAYGLASAAATAGSNATVAIVDAYDDANIEKDLATYSTTFKLPACTTKNGCFRKVDQNGGTAYPSANSGWSLEIALDVETVHAVCPLCHILLVEAASANYADLVAAEDRAVAMGATVVSNSWGSGEFSTETGYDPHFDHAGVPITVSSGDGSYGVEYPAASPYVTAVGGTTLKLDSNNARISETAWSGAGSGCSAFESKPGWQTDTGCANRSVADVSADADPNTGAAVYDSVRYQGHSGWFVVGGTSLASPIIAATYALAGNAAATVYGSYPYANAASLFDVTQGSNGTCGTYLCNAVVGYDGPTGLGTPIGVGAF